MSNRKYILDTNILIEFVHGNISVINNIVDVGFDNCCMSVLSLYELYYGAFNCKKKEYFDQEIDRIQRLAKRFEILPLPLNAAKYGAMKVDLRRKGLKIDEFDMLIGSQALTENLIVVTDNLKHFGLIDGLIIENWMNR